MARKKIRDDEHVKRLMENKKYIRENYSRFPLMDWFKKSEPVEPVDSVKLEKNDTLAMILAVFSLVAPWVLGMGAVFAVIVWLISLIGR